MNAENPHPDNQAAPGVVLKRVVGALGAMTCGCPDATIRTTRDFVGMGDEDWPETYQGYTCKCGKCFFPTPQRPNKQIYEPDQMPPSNK